MNSRPRAARSSGQRPSDMTEPPHGSPPSGDAVWRGIPKKVAAAQEPPSCPQSRPRCRRRRSRASITLSGYEGSELLVARLLIEERGGRALCRFPPVPRRNGRRRMSNGSRRAASRSSSGASLEDDLRRDGGDPPPISPSARRPSSRRARNWVSPVSTFYQTSFSARPLMGPMGAGSLQQSGQRGHGQTRTAWIT